MARASLTGHPSCGRRRGRLAAVVSLLTVLLVPGAASAGTPPDYQALSKVSRPGLIEPARFSEQLVWLIPEQTGLYTLRMDGPGVLLLHVFPTADGHPDGQTSPRQLLRDGSPFRPGRLPDLLLEAGRVYLLQVAAHEPRSVVMELATPLDAALALDAPALARLAPDATLGLVPGPPVLVRLQEVSDLRLRADAAHPLRLEVLTDPAADAGGRLDGRRIGPGGVYPLVPGPDTTLRLSAEARGDGTWPLILLRVSATPDMQVNETEPANVTVVAVPEDGERLLRGTLLAPEDTDVWELAVEREGLLDLSVMLLGEHAPDTEARLTLERRSPKPAGDVLELRVRPDGVWRDALALVPGRYRLRISGSQDTPRDYRVRFAPTQTAAEPGWGAEPDDTPLVARGIVVGEPVRGRLAADDPGHLRFRVSDAGHLWEIRAAAGVEDIQLSDTHGNRVGDWKRDAAALAVRLNLEPREYLMRLRGSGPYVLVVRDLGPAGPGLEHEPNDDPSEAVRLGIGMAVSGDFHTSDDSDHYLISLSAPTPLALRLSAPDDGGMLADLDPAGLEPRRGALGPATGPIGYRAVFPAGDTLLRLRAADSGISGRYGVAIERIDWAPPEEPEGVVAMPRDGRIQGRIGGLDLEDRIFLPLPTGSDHAALLCTGVFAGLEVRTFGDAQRIAWGEPGRMIVFPYGPELGGGLDLRLTGQAGEGDYACWLGLRPEPAGELRLLDALDSDPPQLLKPGQRMRGQFEAADAHARLALDLADVPLAGLRCVSAGDPPAPLAPGAALRAESGAGLEEGLLAPAFADGTRPIAATGEPAILRITPPPEAALPLAWQCDLIPPEGFAAPADLGEPAPFTALHTRGGDRAPARAVAYDPAQALSLLLGGREHGLDRTQMTADLPVRIAVDGAASPLRAFSRLGQEAAVTVSLVNSSDGPLELDLELGVYADGWRVVPDRIALTLAAGATAQRAAMIQVPPMQGPVTEPALWVRARSAARMASLVAPLALEADAPERGPHRFWSAPEGLRGGLDPLRHALGARLLALDGEPVSAAQAAKMAFLHDGAALHSAVPHWLSARELTFSLAARAPIVGLRVHLRSAESRDHWPERVGLELSEDNRQWHQALDVHLDASDLPQVFALPKRSQAAYARIRHHGCRADPACGQVALPEIGLVADPAWRLPGPIDIADPTLGGHVLAARALGGEQDDERIFEGAWNLGLLRAGRPLELRPASPRAGHAVEALIGFQDNRAARLTSIAWFGHPDDGTRVEGAEVALSLAGPRGPWRVVGTLAAPRSGETESRLALGESQWARVVRLRFARDPQERRFLPDRIGVFEDPEAPPVLGLWEDDRPDAGWEASAAPLPQSIPAPSGGRDAEHAVALPLGIEQTSSVQLGRNEDWWRIRIPQGPPVQLTLGFPGSSPPEIGWTLHSGDGAPLPTRREQGPEGYPVARIIAPPDSELLLRVVEPPRSVAILWDTSGSVAHFTPRTLAGVRVWAQSLVPGRDQLQLLPFGDDQFLLPDWAGDPADVYPALADLPARDSSDAERALAFAAGALAVREGARGVVIITDAETHQHERLWEPLLAAAPRVIALSIDSSDAESERILKDWVSVNAGYFRRVTGPAALADGLELASALFRGPKAYRVRVDAEVAEEPEGSARLQILAPTLAAGAHAPPPGGIEVILDASGSMLKRLPDGQRRIEVARGALTSLVGDSLPAGMPFAFRAFGLEAGACHSELVVPLGPLDPSAARQAIGAVPAVNEARTAIAESLRLAARDLADVAAPRVVVLVTDGDETCGGDVAAAIGEIRAAGTDLRLTIVGFAIDDSALAETFSAWARAGGGRYLPAEDSAGLDAAVHEAIQPRFALVRLYLDGRASPAGTLAPGETRELPAGRYRLEPLQSASGPPREIVLGDGALGSLVYVPGQGLEEGDGGPGE